MLWCVPRRSDRIAPTASFRNQEGVQRSSTDDGLERDPLPPSCLENTARLPRSVFCPITNAPMSDPVLLADGYSYERAAIVTWLRRRHRSPITGARLSHVFLTPNHSLRLTIRELLEV